MWFLLFFRNIKFLEQSRVLMGQLTRWGLSLSSFVLRNKGFLHIRRRWSWRKWFKHTMHRNQIIILYGNWVMRIASRVLTYTYNNWVNTAMYLTIKMSEYPRFPLDLSCASSDVNKSVENDKRYARGEAARRNTRQRNRQDFKHNSARSKGIDERVDDVVEYQRLT